jgi:magnesium-transporting ATPase (P-type)
MAVAWWVYIGYIYYAGIIFFITLITVIMQVKEIKSKTKEIAQMAHFKDLELTVIRDEEKKRVDSSELVPGDVFEVPL